MDGKQGIRAIRRGVRMLFFASGALWLAIQSGLIMATIPIARMSFWILMLLMLAQSLLDWRFRDPATIKDPSPARSVATVIMATGIAAIFWVMTSGAPENQPIAAAVALATLGAAVLGYRLASKYADQIGEARFKTPSDHT